MKLDDFYHVVNLNCCLHLYCSKHCESIIMLSIKIKAIVQRL